MPGTIRDGHLLRLAVTPLDPAILLHVDVDKYSGHYWWETLVKQPFKELREFALVEYFATI